MRKFILFSILSLAIFQTETLFAQEKPVLSAEALTDLAGNPLTDEIFKNGDKPVIVSFWATWCSPCLQELKSIKAVYPEWQKESGVKLIAISIDRNRQLERVKTLVSERDWPFEVYMDATGAFRSTLNVVNIPHTFVFDSAGNIIYQSTSYSPGDEKKLYEKVKTAKAD